MHKTVAALSVMTSIVAGLSAGPSAADTEFENNIPIDLAKALLRGPGNVMELRIYSDMPDDFPSITLPDDVTLLGSMDQGHSQQVILLSESDGQRELSVLTDSLQQSGYLVIRQPGGNRSQTGFVSANPQELGIANQFCHDTQGMFYIRLQPAGDRTFINLTAMPNPNRGGYSCADMAAQATNRPGSTAFFVGSPGARSLQTSLPRLVLPDEAETETSFQPRLGRISGSSDHAESKTEFVLDWSLAEIYEHFADQVVDQGWIPDGETTGNRVALGVWIKEDDDQLLGTLRLVSGDDDGYQAMFTVSLLD